MSAKANARWYIDTTKTNERNRNFRRKEEKRQPIRDMLYCVYYNSGKRIWQENQIT